MFKEYFFHSLTLFASLAADDCGGTKKFVWGGIVGIDGANIAAVSFFGAAPDGLNTSTYDFLSAIKKSIRIEFRIKI